MNLFSCLVIVVATSTALADDTTRYIEKNVLVSKSHPPMQFMVDPAFAYVGHIRFTLKEAADVERHHWVKTDGNGIQALIIVQFEGYLDGVNGSYSFRIPPQNRAAGSNYRFSPTRIRLGSHDYVHNTWAYDDGQNIRDNPRAESARTHKFLTEHGHALDAGLIMSRFVREVGEDRRRELIVFYIEPLARNGVSLEDFPDGGPVSKKYDSLSQQVMERSLGAFEIVDTH